MRENAKANETTEPFTRISEAFLNMDCGKAMGLYLDFIENMTEQFLEFQETLMHWTKETPLEPFVEFNTSLSRKLVETSISAVRNLYQIERSSAQ